MASVRLVAYVPLLFVAAAVSLALAGYTWRNREAPGATPLTGMLLGMVAWAGFYGLGLLTHSLDLRLLWLRLNWMGSGFVSAFWLLFALEYTGRQEWLTRRTVGAIVALPVVTVLLAWTTPFHDLMWTDPYVQDLGAVTILRYDDGIWQVVFEVYTYATIALATALIGGLVVRHRDLYTDQAVALILGSFMPAVGYLVSALRFSAPGVDLTPLTFPVTGALFAFVIFRGDLFEALSTTAAVGQDAAVEAMQDAVVVTDEDDEVIEANPAATALLGTGTPVGKPLAAVPTLGDVPLDGTERRVEVTTPDNRALEVTVTPIEDVQDRVIGHGLVLRDITDRRNYRQRLQITNRVLRHNLRNDMTVVIGNADTIGAVSDDDRVASLADGIVDAADSLTASGNKARQVEELLGGDADAGPTDLDTVAERVVGAAREEYPDATISLESVGDCRAVALDGIDAAIREAIANAIEHHSDDATVDVRVEPDGESVVVTVVDDGPGIPGHEAEVVLEQGGESALSHASGTGLWLIKWLVERSGGSVAIDTPEGTRVRLTLPRAEG
jgi:signal transduction histidine kinase